MLKNNTTGRLHDETHGRDERSRRRADGFNGLLTIACKPAKKPFMNLWYRSENMPHIDVHYPIAGMVFLVGAVAFLKVFDF